MRRDAPPGPLIQAAARALGEGPRHTLDLAREVLGLSGNPGAASAAVFALLGADRRFEVDGQGCWTLVGPAPGTPLSRLRYAVVDVETTGGPYASGHRITEVAVYEVHRGEVGEGFRTLINPGRPIPPRVAALTGIRDAMVADAPFFEDVAETLRERLEGRVFVAHNVRFDWGFVSRQFADATGDVPRVERLCTVRMARHLVPGLRRRNLDALARHFGVEIPARHRAWGDALATARVFLRLLDEAERAGVADLDALRALLRRRPRRSRPRQGQQLSLLAGEGTGEESE
ncbi:MAG: 3'-5' exonuclease [Gemmatimonadetes bacterium]|nr:MAG: 3'-5' exonuclease [Gemmatimonadota bacterium]